MMTLKTYKATHPRCAVCWKPLTLAERTIQHLCRGTGRKDDERCIIVSCWLPCHVARDNTAGGQFVVIDGVKWPKLTDGNLLWCKLIEDGSLDLGFLTNLRRSLIEAVIAPPPTEYLERRARHGQRGAWC